MMTLEKTTDSIRVDMTLKAPKAKVWAALTTVEGWTGWFSEGVKGDFQVGSLMTLTFEGYGEAQVTVVERVEESSFAYRWHPGGEEEFNPEPELMTTVRFEVFEQEHGTRLIMTESGFANLPEARRLNALGMNEGGWKAELAELVELVDSDRRQRTLAYTIKQERVYPAPLEKVWWTLATGPGLEAWFCKKADGDFALGEMVVLTFEFPSGAIDGPLKVVEYDPMTRLAWRWHPGQDDGCKWGDFPEKETTLVRFTLAEVPEGTEVKLIEYGFENIPESRRDKVFGMNQQGWAEVFQMVADYLTKE